MFTTLWRKLRADFKINKLQLLLISGVLVLSSMLLTISVLVLGSADEPWDRTFAETNGPHLWVVSHQYDLDFSPLTQNQDVSESTDVILALADNPLVLEDEKIPTFLYAMDELPNVSHPIIAKGRWIDPAKIGEIVLDFSLAKYYDFQVGDVVTILGTSGKQSLTVVGLAVTAHWFPYDEITKDVSPAAAYLSFKTMESLQPDPKSWYSVVGLRLKEPDSSQAMADQVYDLFPGKLQSVIEWQFVKENATLGNTLNAMFMGLFSLLGLAAVGMIIFNTIGGQVLSQYREIGLLKAVGFSPNQVTLLFLGEHLAIGFLATILGIALGLAIAPGLVGTMAENLNTTPPNIYTPSRLVGILLLVEVAVGLATLLPAIQGGRIDTVQAITVGYRSHRVRVSRLAKAAAWLRMPSVIILGVKDTFSRPLRSVLAIASLFLTVFVAMTAIGAETTAEYLASNRFYFNGTTADMKVVRNFVPQEIISAEILSRPEVTDNYEELILYGQAPGHGDQPITIRLLQGNFENFDFQIKEGRMINAPNEAVMGYAVYDLLDAHIGDTIEISVKGDPIRLTLVGRHAENLNTNHVVMTGLETYRNQVVSTVEPNTYNLRLSDDGNAENLRKDWLDQFQGLINVSVVREEPVTSVIQLKNLIASMAVILMLVAIANLMSTSMLSIRERMRDFGIQKTLGLTPAQIAASVIVGTVLITLIALLLGITLGMAAMESFVQQVGIAIGAGPDFYFIHWGGISLLLPFLVVMAIVSSLVPAMRAARIEVAEALRYE